jgi:hypothetical protein
MTHEQLVAAVRGQAGAVLLQRAEEGDTAQFRTGA